MDNLRSKVKQKHVIDALIECLHDIKNSSETDASYHLTDISNNIEQLIDSGTLTESKGRELENKVTSIFNFVKKVK